MSDDVIKVHDLSGIEQYSESISQFSKALDTATNDTARAFNNKIEGSEGIAISSFLQSLNDLQTQIFDQIPEVLGNYAKIVEGFSSSVSGIGFGKEAWTSESGNSDVRTKLTGDQKDSVLTVDKNLQTVLDTAATALGEGSIDISNITNNAINGLEDAATARLNTHTPFQAAHDTFNSNLQQVIGTISNLKGSVGRAQIILNLSPKAVFNAFSQGQPYFLDSITNQDEALAIEAAFGDVNAVKKVNFDNVSDVVLYIMSDGVAMWAANDEFNNLDIFYSHLGKNKDTYNSDLLARMVKAQQKLAITNQMAMSAEYSQNGYSSKKLSLLKKKEKGINELIGITRGLFILGYGEDQFEVRPGSMSEKIDNPKSIKFKRNKSGELGFTIIGVWGQESKYTSDFAQDSTVLNIAEQKAKFAEIEQKRKDAANELIKGIVFSAGDGIATVYAPELKLALTALKLMSSGDMVGGASKLNPAEVDLSGAVGTSLSAILKSSVDYIKTNQGLNEQERKAIFKIKNLIVNKGGWIFRGYGNTLISDEFYYQFDVTLRKEELDSEGVTEFMKTKALSENEYQKSLSQYKNILESGYISEEYDSKTGEYVVKQYDSKMIKYLLGEKTDLVFEGMNKSQVEQLEKGIEAMDQLYGNNSNGKDFYDYLREKYDDRRIGN
ncbi:hypothetical protein D8880_05355 [Streptococcus sanguinis]|uniref:hypothetical protein n=1 Tax=Streptococcus sanguinis TaxID=1305 RepID=UPI000F666090|nr:hypothetical protein [Streptococcus sanguinis]RSI27645.1 hypothetical protein D8880_05355 [Streptococcus sanguinis]